MSCFCPYLSWQVPMDMKTRVPGNCTMGNTYNNQSRHLRCCALGLEHVNTARSNWSVRVFQPVKRSRLVCFSSIHEWTNQQA